MADRKRSGSSPGARNRRGPGKEQDNRSVDPRGRAAPKDPARPGISDEELAEVAPELSDTGGADAADAAGGAGTPTAETGDTGRAAERLATDGGLDEDSSEELGVDNIVGPAEAGLGGGLDEQEEAQLGITDEEIAAKRKGR